MEQLKAWLPLVLAVIGAAYALERRLAAIEHSVAVVEWRLTYHHGAPPWDSKPREE